MADARRPARQCDLLVHFVLFGHRRLAGARLAPNVSSDIPTFRGVFPLLVVRNPSLSVPTGCHYRDLICAFVQGDAGVAALALVSESDKRGRSRDSPHRPNQ